MLGRVTFGVAAVATALPLAALSAKPVIDLAPSSPWNMNYADDSCMLIRAFGTERQRILVRFERAAPTSRFSLTLFGAPFKTNSNKQEITLTFEPGGSTDKRDHAPSGSTEGKLPLVIVESASFLGSSGSDLLDFAPIPPSAERAINALLVDPRKAKAAYRLKLGSMGPPMEAMRKCTDELLGHWGLDAAAQRALKTLPMPLAAPQSWLSSSDYPKEQAQNGQSAVIRFRLTVDEAGLPTDCAVQSGTRGTDFSKRTCELLARPRKI